MDSSDFGQKSMSSRLKASNFAASFIKIGEWQDALSYVYKYLDKHYENLLLSEPRFFKLSKQSFPTLKNPFFHSISRGNPGSAFDYNHRGQDFNLRMQFNFPNFPSHVGQTQHIQPYGHRGLSSLKEMPTPASDSCNVLENQRMSYWGQGMSIYTDALARNQGLVPSVQSTQVHPTVPFQSYTIACKNRRYTYNYTSSDDVSHSTRNNIVSIE